MRLNEAFNFNNQESTEVFEPTLFEGMGLRLASTTLATVLGTAAGGAIGAVVGGYSAGAAVTGGLLSVGATLSTASTLLSIGMLPATGVAVIFGMAALGAYALGSTVGEFADDLFISKTKPSRELVKNIKKRDSMLIKLSSEQNSANPTDRVIEKYQSEIKRLTDEQKRLGGSLVNEVEKAFRNGTLSDQEYKDAIVVAKAAHEGRLTSIK